MIRRVMTLSTTLLVSGVVLSMSSSPAMAQNLGGIDVVPSKGDVTTLISIVTERGCTEPAERVSAVLFGKGLPETGQVVVASNEVGLSTTRPMELPLSNAFLIYGQNNNTALVGKYTLKVRCTDRIGRPLDEFTTTMNWSTPGGKFANLNKATFTAVSNAGVVAAAAPDGASKTSAPGSGSSQAQPTNPTGSKATGTPEPSSSRPPLANEELPDGSNPDAARVAEGDSTTAAASDSTSPARTALFVGGAVLALIAAAVIFLRGRRASS